MDDSNTVFLLIHGFTGTHYEMDPLAEYLEKLGHKTKNITLPGHETTPEDMAQTKWHQWTTYAQKELDELKQKYEKVYVAGLSMGGAITLYLGANNPDLQGIITMATPYKPTNWKMQALAYLPFLKYLIPWNKPLEEEWEDKEREKLHKSYYDKFHTQSVLELIQLLNNVKKLLPQITIPILSIHSKNDVIILPVQTKEIHERIGSKDKTAAFLKNGAHVVTMDAGREEAFEIIKEWLERKA